MSSADLLRALQVPEDAWEAAEREREAQALERAFVAKWLPIWTVWGIAQPGYERFLVKSPTS